MKSKTSFFNKTIFWKNVAMYWPVWVIYLIVLLLFIPGQLWMNLHNMERYSLSALTVNNGLEAIYQSVDVRRTILIIFVMAVITGMALYSYLYVAKSANMIHALPVTRSELFGTNVISGLLFMLVPEIIAFLGGVIVCLSYGMTCVEYLGLWLLTTLEISVFAYAMVTFSAMLTGQLAALPVYFAALNVLYLGLYTVISSVVSYMGYGLCVKSMDELGMTWLSPIYYLLNRVCFRAHIVYKGNAYVCEELVLQGGDSTVWFLIPAAVFFLAAYILYRKRQLEHAGDLVAVPVLKPVFRWGVGFVGGFLVAVWLVTTLTYVVEYVPKWLVLLFSVILGVIFFFAAEMLIRKNFKVFKKRAWMECGAFIVFMLVCSGVMAGTAHTKEQYVPEQEEIAKASVSCTYPVDFDEEDCGQILEWHRFLVEHADELKKTSDDQDVWYVAIDYELKDGKKISRYYPVAVGDETEDFFCYLYELELDAGHFTEYLFGSLKPELLRYESGYFLNMDSSWDYVSDTSLGREETQILAEAVLADIEAGTLQKYNLSDPLGKGEIKRYTCNLALYHESGQNDTEDYWEEVDIYGYYYYEQLVDSNDIWINFGADCENIIHALIQTGVIDSVDDLNLSAVEY